MKGGDWLTVLGGIGMIAFGAYTLLTGHWLLRGAPNETVTRIGGGFIVFLGLVVLLAGLGLVRENEPPI